MEIIAEVGLNHYGRLDVAEAYIEEALQAGASTVKFQFHMSAHEPNAPLRVPMPGIRDRADLWDKTAFAIDEWQSLKESCEDKGLGFLASVFCPQAAETLLALGQRRFKVPSGQLLSNRLLDVLSASESDVLLSTGLHPYHEVERAVQRLSGCQVTLLACVTSYPSAPGQICIPDWAHGLSDHSGTIWPGIVAAWEGCQCLEVHVTMNKALGGPDDDASLTFGELATLVDGVEFIEEMASGLDHDRIVSMPSVQQLRRMFIPSEMP